jgi:hypothetical protein
MQESTLHAELKQIYCQDNGRSEIWVDGYLIDVVKNELLIEIQTRAFGALKNKLEALLDRHPICLVHPIAQEKVIISRRTDGTIISRRRSPKKGRLEDLFYELVFVGSWVNHPNFSLEVLITIEEEHRIADGKGSWRRKGVSIQDRSLVNIVEKRLFCIPTDYRMFLPTTLVSGFTNREFADYSRIPYRLASKMTYTLLQIGILDYYGKSGRANRFIPKSEF